MEIFRPFYGKGWTLKTFDTRQSTPEAMFWSSLTQLERLALEYRQNHASAASSIFWHLSLLYIGNAVVRHPTGPIWHFNFMLCMYAYADLAGSFRVAEAFLRAILYMAVDRKLVSHEEALAIMKKLPNEEVFINSGHTADYEGALDDRSSSQATELARRLNDELIFVEFVASAENGYGQFACPE
jgi:hypothetical protein